MYFEFYCFVGDKLVQFWVVVVVVGYVVNEMWQFVIGVDVLKMVGVVDVVGVVDQLVGIKYDNGIDVYFMVVFVNFFMFVDCVLMVVVVFFWQFRQIY